MLVRCLYVQECIYKTRLMYASANCEAGSLLYDGRHHIDPFSPDCLRSCQCTCFKYVLI